jgi:hypothetical protein
MSGCGLKYQTDKDWLCLAGHKDIFNGEIVGCAMGEMLEQELAKPIFIPGSKQPNVRLRVRCITQTAAASTAPMSTDRYWYN